MPRLLWWVFPGGVGVSEWACPLGGAVGEGLVGPSVVSEAVVAAAHGGEVVGVGGSVFGPGGGVVEVAVGCWHAASREDAGAVSCLYVLAV